jgi:predicted glycosyltransferase
MKILITTGTPAHVHFFRNAALALERRGHEVVIAAPQKESILKLLKNSGLKYRLFGERRGPTLLGTVYSQLRYEFKVLLFARRFKPDILVGFGGIAVSHIGKLIRKPSIVITDMEHSVFTNMITMPFATVVLTPSSFQQDFGKKHLRFSGYKELAYLHPDYFKPDPSVLSDLGLAADEKYVILRFNILDAVHDIGRHGFAVSDQYKLVEELSKYARVFISPEGNLPQDLEKYRLPIAYNRIHHALYYAQMIVADTGTMVTEAALLGTPAIRCYSNVAKYGNYIEIERDYDLMYVFRDAAKAISKAVDLIEQPDLKEQWAKKRQILLSQKINVTEFIIDFIENYPASVEKYRKKST